MRTLPVMIAFLLLFVSISQAQYEYTLPFVPNSEYDSSVISPDEFLGYPLGSRAVSHQETVNYFNTIADSVDHAELHVYAQSHENRDLIYLVISSPENMKRLDDIKEGIHKLYDPRKLSSDREAQSILDKSPAVAWMSYAIHGDELSSTDAAVWVAYQLAAGRDERTQSILKNTVVIIDPLQNPDGRERILSLLKIYRGNVLNPDVNSVQFNGVWPYGRGNHYWFDLNRDFFILAHPESRGRVQGYLEWCPQFYVDSHEMGALNTYLFSPPRQPINNNIPDNFHKWIKTFAQDQAKAFDQYGWSYYTREWFEDWYPGYTFWVAYTGSIAMLYEQAGVQGTAVRRPDGTTMTYRETVHHQITSSLANLTTVATHRKELLSDYLAVKKDTVAPLTGDEVHYYLIKPGNNSSREMELIGKLLWQGIELYQLQVETPVQKALGIHDDAVAQTVFPKGTWVIPTRQPQKRLINAILEFDPELNDEVLRDERFHLEKMNSSRMYDWTAWTMFLAYGVDAYQTGTSMNFNWSRVESVEALEGSAPGAEAKYGYIIPGDDNSSTHAVTALLENGIQVRVAEKDFSNHGVDFPKGSFLVRNAENPDISPEQIKKISRDTGATIYNADTALSLETYDLGGGYFGLLAAPRIAMFTQVPVHPYSYGYTWHFLDETYQTRFAGLDINVISQVDLRKYNVIILPSSFNAGRLNRTIHESGFKKLRQWIEDGGTLIALGSSVGVLADENNQMSSVRERGDVLEELDVYREYMEREKKAVHATASREDVYTYSSDEVDAASATESKKGADLEKLKRDESWERRFSPQGAFLNVDVDSYHWLTYGVDDPLSVMVSSRNVYFAKPPVQTPIRFVDGDALRASGLLWKEARKRYEHSAYLTQERVGRGQIILFPFEPHQRGYFPATQRILWNAIFLGPGLGADQPVPW